MSLFWCGQDCVVLVALFVDFKWSVKILLTMQDGAVVGVHTSGFRCHTPAVDLIEYAWLYFMDVVYIVICAPPLNKVAP